MSKSAAAKWWGMPVGLALIWIYLVWGSTYLSNRMALESMPPFLISGIRFLIAGSILLVICRLTGVAMPRRGDWLAAAVPGVLMIAVGQGSMVFAGQTLPSGIVALLFALLPIWTALLQWLLPGGQRPSNGILAGLLLGSAGMLLLVSGGDASAAGNGVNGGADGNTAGAANAQWHIAAVVTVVIGTISWAIAALLIKRSTHKSSALQGAALQMLVGGASLVILATLCGEWQNFSISQISDRSAWAFSYLVIIASVITYPVYNCLVKAGAPTLVASFAFVNPVVALYLGWLAFDEKMSMLTVLSSGLILCGVITITFAQARTNKKLSCTQKNIDLSVTSALPLRA